MHVEWIMAKAKEDWKPTIYGSGSFSLITSLWTGKLQQPNWCPITDLDEGIQILSVNYFALTWHGIQTLKSMLFFSYFLITLLTNWEGAPVFHPVFLGLRGPILLPLVGRWARPPARKNVFSSSFSSFSFVSSLCPVTPGRPFANHHLEGPASCK